MAKIASIVWNQIGSLQHDSKQKRVCALCRAAICKIRDIILDADKKKFMSPNTSDTYVPYACPWWHVVCRMPCGPYMPRLLYNKTGLALGSDTGAAEEWVDFLWSATWWNSPTSRAWNMRETQTSWVWQIRLRCIHAVSELLFLLLCRLFFCVSCVVPKTLGMHLRQRLQ